MASSSNSSTIAITSSSSSIIITIIITWRKFCRIRRIFSIRCAAEVATEEVAVMATMEEVAEEVAAARRAAVEAAVEEEEEEADAHRRFEPVAHRVPVVARTRIKSSRLLIARGRQREDTARASKGDSRTPI